MRSSLQYVDAVWAATRMHDEAKTVARQRQIWENKVIVLEKALSSHELPAEFKGEAPALYSAYYFKTACVCLRHGAGLKALGYLRRAVVLRPRLALNQGNWRSLLEVLWKLARYGSHTRYRPGVGRG